MVTSYGLPDKIKNAVKRITPFYLLLLAITPLLISLLIHLFALYCASLVTWGFAQKAGAEQDIVEQDISATVDLNGKKDDKLLFQGTDPLDSFEADEKLDYPVPEIEYRPVVPEMEILPDPKPVEQSDIISAYASAMDQKWVYPATGGQPLHTGPGRFVGSFSRHVQALREGGLDVVFVFDSTSSMSGVLTKIKLKIENLAIAFRKLVPTCRIGLVTYRDKQDKYVTKKCPFTFGISPLQEFLGEVKSGGGYDIREAVTEGIKEAIDGMKWNERSRKFILLLGDAPPHKEDIRQAVDLVRKFREKMGGTFSTLDLHVPEQISFEMWNATIRPTMEDPEVEGFEHLTDKNKVMGIYALLAETGGGESARLIDEEKVVKHMLLLIFGTKWESYLDEFMKNL